ncbi:MAG: hypothetical protein QXO86_03290 [Nitrososphaerota archaeon]
MPQYARIFGRATALALILTLPPLLGLFYLWSERLHGPLEIVIWLVSSLLWNTLILALFVKGKLFPE